MRPFNLCLSVLTSVLVIPTLIFNRKRILCKASKDSYCTSDFTYVKDEKPSVNIAIIGSGLGGSSAAYFARRLFGSRAKIDVYESADQVGGRVGVVEIAGRLYESGGSVLHPKNLYMKSFVQEFGLNVLKSLETDSRVGIYNGADFAFQGSKWKIINIPKILWRYGLDLFTFDDWVRNMLKHFANIYTEQAEGKSYQNVEEMMMAMGGRDFVEMMNRTTREELKRRGVKDMTIDEIATGVMRVNYGQDTSINAFAGSVSLAGVEGGLWSVEGGNWKVCESLLTASGATVFKNTKVSQVTRVPGKDLDMPPTYSIATNLGQRNQYDVVIVAIPLTSPDHFIPCTTCSNWPKMSDTKKFWTTVATFVQGEINYKHFGFEKEDDVPEGILTTENSENYFNSIGLQQPVQGRENTDIRGKPVRKVFSRKILTEDQLQELFLVRNETEVISWLAYPDLKPGKYFTSFVLDDGVFYVNAIEHAASAMEMMCLGAKNAALLAHQYQGKKKDNEKEKVEKKVNDEL